jgi:thymidylate synthase|tara:strand:+ start:2561 stop:3319 length:759 start_codon:yes stop_codon:yes gene_type:complete
MRAKDLKEGLYLLRKKLLEQGYEIETERWQGDVNHPSFLEILHADLVVPMAVTADESSDLLEAQQPWADEHFEERVGGIPCNPPPSHVHWLKDTDKYLMDEAFSHSYPERMWQNNGDKAERGILTQGIRFNIANLNTAVELLKKEPTTRQCYIPIWFPEDLTAAYMGERVPCTFGWHFMLRGEKLHCSYHMRSCDVMRHLHNDLYFANRLAIWLIKEAELIGTIPGTLHFSSTSLHCFMIDKYSLDKLCADF